MRDSLWRTFNIQKVAFICLLLLGAAAFVHFFDTEESTPIKKPLKDMPTQIGHWLSVNERELALSVAAMLGVDDYIFRDYRAPDGMGINLYVSFFSSVNHNKGFHSPLHCMPGSGWSVASTKKVSLKLPGVEEIVQIRSLLLERGNEFQISLYWYQCRSKIFASEYWELFYRILDSFRYRRTDGAFVRLIATGAESEAEALIRMKAFAKKIIPLLEIHLPDV